MMKKNDLVSSALFGETQEITDELVEYYRKNPNELDLIIDKENFHINFLSFFFLLGFGLTIVARVLNYFLEDSLGTFVSDVILDVASELGIAIFGGAVTAYLLEFLQKRQYEQNIKFREDIKTRLAYQK